MFPEIEPYNSFRLKVSDIHELYVEEVGNPNGQPALFLHGGPGGGFGPPHRRLFDPAHYRLILFDQRGAGRSTPFASLEQNTTWDLVADIEKIREHLGIERWVVHGGSWGVTLALAYAQTHPERVSGLILRGVFLCRPEEIRWFYQESTRWIFPDFFELFEKPVSPEKRGDMVQSYYELLTHPDEKVRGEAARAWSRWEGSTVKLVPDPELISHFEDEIALAIARIECHYFVHHCWLEENQLLNNADRIRHIPTYIVHGRYDVVCPAKNAWDLHKAFPEAHLNIVPDAGHAFNEPGILAGLIAAQEALKDPAFRTQPLSC